MKRPALLLAASLVASLTASAAEEPEMPTFSSATSAVVLDVIVRDRAGHVVRDLRPTDFRIYEDGAEQTIDSFQVVSRDVPAAEPPEAPASAGAAPDGSRGPFSQSGTTPRPTPAVVALVFDRLSPAGRDFARRAALDYLHVAYAPGDEVGIFSLDLALRSISPFSDDREQIRAGIEEAARQALTASSEQDAREKVRQRLGTLSHDEDLLKNATAGAGSQQSTNGNPGTTYGDLASAITIERRAIAIERGAEGIERDQRGYATTRGLLAVVRGLGSVRGRKTIVLFSEGLTITSAVKQEFRTVIDAANRGNVSFYTVDAGGLRAKSALNEARQELESSQDRRMRQFIDEKIEGSLTKQLERGEEMLRFSPRATLGPLAVETGGFYVGDSNAVSDKLREMAQDMRFQYVLSYTPNTVVPDGRFRKVKVEVARRGVRVRTRSGYIASHDEDQAPNGTIRAVAALFQQPRPRAFPVYARAMHFPEPQGHGRAPLFVEVPASGLGFAPDDEGRFRGDLTLVVRVLNAAGKPEATLQQRYAPVADSGKPSEESVLFHPELDLDPGRYTMEVAAYDAVSRAASVRDLAFEVPAAPPQGVQLSSLVVAKGVRTLLPQEGPTDSPLAIDGSLLQPNLGEAVSKATNPALGFYFVAQTDGQTPPRKATVEVWHGRDCVRSRQVTLQQPASDGCVRQAGSLPLGTLPPADYRLRVTLAQGDRSVDAETVFTVVD